MRVCVWEREGGILDKCECLIKTYLKPDWLTEVIGETTQLASQVLCWVNNLLVAKLQLLITALLECCKPTESALLLDFVLKICGYRM